MLTLNRRRCMGGDVVPLPPGYTPLAELSVTSGNYYIDTGVTTITASQNPVYRFVSKVKYHTVNSSLRQLCGNAYNPWFGCNYGRIDRNGGSQPSSPAIGTSLYADVWYDIDVPVESRSNHSCRILLFTLCNSGTTLSPNSTYQCYMSIKQFFDIYENNELIRHMIPCTNPNNEEGLYDTVEESFHPLTSY